MRLQQNENGFQQVKIDFSSAHQVAHVNVKVQSQLELGFLCCSPWSFREAGRACRQSKLSRELPWELVPAWGRGGRGGRLDRSRTGRAGLPPRSAREGDAARARPHSHECRGAAPLGSPGTPCLETRPSQGQ